MVLQVLHGSQLRRKIIHLFEEGIIPVFPYRDLQQRVIKKIVISIPRRVFRKKIAQRLPANLTKVIEFAYEHINNSLILFSHGFTHCFFHKLKENLHGKNEIRLLCVLYGFIGLDMEYFKALLSNHILISFDAELCFRAGIIGQNIYFLKTFMKDMREIGENFIGNEIVEIALCTGNMKVIDVIRTYFGERFTISYACLNSIIISRNIYLLKYVIQNFDLSPQIDTEPLNIYRYNFVDSNDNPETQLKILKILQQYGFIISSRSLEIAAYLGFNDIIIFYIDNNIKPYPNKYSDDINWNNIMHATIAGNNAKLFRYLIDISWIVFNYNYIFACIGYSMNFEFFDTIKGIPFHRAEAKRLMIQFENDERSGHLKYPSVKTCTHVPFILDAFERVINECFS